VSSYQWALLFHLTGAFVYAGGMLVSEAAWFRARDGTGSREIRALLDVSKAGELLSQAGAVTLLGFALWLVDLTPYGFGDAWIIAALSLFVLQGAPVNVLARRRKEARAVAGGLAADGAAPSPELGRLLHGRGHAELSHLSSLLTVAILVLMVWKPGA
jgi:uncharacterized membrane protein